MTPKGNPVSREEYENLLLRMEDIERKMIEVQSKRVRQKKDSDESNDPKAS